MTSPTVLRWSPSAAAPVSCGLCASTAHDGLHLGLIVCEENQRHYVLHMGWHQEKLIAELPNAQRWWHVRPTFDDDELEALTNFASLAQRKLDVQRLPFGLSAQDARFTRAGAVELGAAKGLNCVTFVQMLFKAAKVPLLLAPGPEDLDEARVAEDREAQARLVATLREDAPLHAQSVETEVGAPRVRPEEVAAASGMAPRPVGFADAMRAGVVVRRKVMADRR
ncbi:MAG: hypothetical protein JNM72_11375 [Deltaproteobacteria bacterium]|nr:hypothetical protein [Deltaproteobacteria bacterium]